MATNAPTRTMTLAEFRVLPEEDGVDRELFRGEIVETEMTKRNRWHAQVEAMIAHLLNAWSLNQGARNTRVFSGEVGCEFPELESSVGIDVALFSTELLGDQDAQYIVGSPILAVEILSPSARHEQTQQKIDLYLQGGVKSVWMVDPHFRTLTVHQSGTAPHMFSGDDRLEDAENLPGFSVLVSALFE